MERHSANIGLAANHRRTVERQRVNQDLAAKHLTNGDTDDDSAARERSHHLSTIWVSDRLGSAACVRREGEREGESDDVLNGAERGI
ncbi:MAG: hypothetical protein GY696_13800 [Gammaproteobacteria bacterium]|nr:hypothetical protein [Gammaproteobacteria bacterium]